MIYINQARLRIPPAWEQQAATLAQNLLTAHPSSRAAYVDSKRLMTWGHDDLVSALRHVVGNKCWYSEVLLEGADPNVDHFRPKGRVVEIDCNTFEKTGAVIEGGYWWLAFEWRNYRLSSQHANQRRIDANTNGGKADFFPVEGARAPEGTEWDMINELVLPLDPCSFSDVCLMWFDPEGRPGLRDPDSATILDQRRIKVTIWLYHLDKQELVTRRAKVVEDIRTHLYEANNAYKLWNPEGPIPNHQQKGVFDRRVQIIKYLIADDAIFAGAKRCAVQLAKSEYPWIERFNVV